MYSTATTSPSQASISQYYLPCHSTHHSTMEVLTLSTIPGIQYLLYPHAPPYSTYFTSISHGTISPQSHPTISFHHLTIKIIKTLHVHTSFIHPSIHPSIHKHQYMNRTVPTTYILIPPTCLIHTYPHVMKTNTKYHPSIPSILIEREKKTTQHNATQEKTRKDKI